MSAQNICSISSIFRFMATPFVWLANRLFSLVFSCTVKEKTKEKSKEIFNNQHNIINYETYNNIEIIDSINNYNNVNLNSQKKFPRKK